MNSLKKVLIWSLAAWMVVPVQFVPLIAHAQEALEDEVLVIQGCTDETALNYDATATEDDGSCEYEEEVVEVVLGCTDETALNYDATATEDDGSCEYEEEVVDENDTNQEEEDIEGCTDEAAENYDPTATVDDESCTYAPEQSSFVALEAEEELGTITICKLYSHSTEGLITDSQYLPEQSFSVDLSLLKPIVTNSVYSWEFNSANFSPNTSIIEDNDAECHVFENVPFGQYYYEENQVAPTSEVWSTPRYNDEYNMIVDELTDLQIININNDNYNGVIQLNTTFDPSFFERRIVVLNEFSSELPDIFYCANGVVEPEHGETCDDENTLNGDGCSDTCQLEGPLSCEQGAGMPGWYGEYFVYEDTHPDMQPSDFNTDFGDPLSDEGAWIADWYDEEYFTFARIDSSLNFGSNFFPADMAATEFEHNGHNFYFGAHWRSVVTVDSSETYSFSLRSDDDSWLYVDGELVGDNSGVHAAKTVTGSFELTGTHVIDVFFAERHTVASHMALTFSPELPLVVSLPDECPIPSDYSEYCGDGEVNQSWEQCDGTQGCTDQCQLEEQVECSDRVFARVVTEAIENEGSGDMSSDVYLGSAENVIPGETWFLLYDNGSFVTDADLAAYEDVPGYAVQRLADSVRLVMHTNLTSSDYEAASGYIEFYNATSTSLEDDSVNKLENGFNGTYGPSSNDEVWIEDGKSYFWLAANTGDDGYYTNWSIIEDCIVDYCGDGMINQDWEQCDGAENNCTEQCQFEEQSECRDLVLARVVSTNVANTGNGDMTSDVYLGSAENVIPDGTWFALYQDGSAITDADVASYENVPGYAVQRVDGKVRLVMHTSVNSGSEHAEGQIEFYNATVTLLANDNSNKLENGFNGTTGNSSNDEVWIGEDGNSYFWLHATSGDDGYYTSWSIVEDCGTGGSDPEYTAYCGDGVENQDWEQCDDSEGCTDQCQFEEQNECSDRVFARVVVDEVANTGAGDLTSNIYLGSTTTVMPNGTWFLLSENGTALTDAGIGSFEDVPGFAVQRLDGQVLLSMYASHPQSSGYEHGEGYIEFYNATVASLQDGTNGRKLENGFNGSFGGAGNDEVWKGEDGNSYFWLSATSGDDAYFTNWIIDEDCEDDVCEEHTIMGVKFHDLNQNGVQDEGEDGLSGWEFTIYASDDTELTLPLASTTSDEDGLFVLTLTADEDSSSYIVAETLQEGWYNSNGSTSQVVGIEECSGVVYFGNYTADDVICEEHDITGLKFHDENENGIQDEGEDGLSGWEFTLYAGDDTELTNPLATTTSDEDGLFSFVYTLESATSGAAEYIIVETLQEGWVSSTGIQQTVSTSMCSVSLFFGNYEEDDDDGGDDGGSGGGSGGGGGGGGTLGLFINAETVAGSTANEATVTWSTNRFADSRVVYDTVSHSILGTAPNFGYAASTALDPTDVTFHTVVITGLLPSTTYYWRAISEEGFNQAIGDELTFTTDSEGVVLGASTTTPTSTPPTTPPSGGTNPTGPQGGNPGSSGGTGGGTTGGGTPTSTGIVAGAEFEEDSLALLADDQAPTSTPDATDDSSDTTDEDQQDTDDGGFTWLWWLLLLILILLYWYYQHTKKNNQGQASN